MLSFSIDATVNDGHPGRFINHSKTHDNLETKVVEIEEGEPHLCFFASKEVNVGDELLYDYGDRRKEVLEANEWLDL